MKSTLSALCSVVGIGLLLAVLVGCEQVASVETESENTEYAWTSEVPSSVDESFLANSKNTPPGFVKHVSSFPPGQSAEGIAIDKRGNMYVGKRTYGASLVSEVVRIAPDGSEELFATLPESAPDAFGMLGLVTDPPGNVFVAHASGDPSTRGVYRIGRNGTPVERLPGSLQIETPNTLTFDEDGNLYASDSYSGKIWKYDGVGFAEWLYHPLLEPVPVPGSPFPIPGVNGIAFYPPNKLYAANTSQGVISRALIGDDGTFDGIAPVAGGFLLFSIDGIAIDVHENIYGPLAVANAEETGAPPLPPVVKVDPHTGSIAPLLTDVSDFDTPTSLVFGTGGEWRRKSLFVVNAALFGPVTNGPGTGVVEINVGTPGLPGK